MTAAEMTDYWAPPVGIDLPEPVVVPGVDPSDALGVLPPGVSDQDKGLWLAVRRTGIGASDVSGLLGLNKRKSRFEVYADKRGEITWVDPDNDAARLGRVLEPVVRQLYTEDVLGADTAISTHGGTLRSVRWPWLMVNPDGILLHRMRGDGMSWPVYNRTGYEGKTCSLWLAHEWDGDQVPDHAEVQCQVVMAVCGFVGMHVGCLIGGQRPVYRYVERDDDLIRDLVEITEEFWHDHILAGVEPDPDASVACEEFLTRRYPRVMSDAPPVVADDADVAKIVALRAAERAANTYVKAGNAGKNLARQLMGEAEELHDAKGRTVATWRQTGAFDASTFAADNPELAVKYTRTVPQIDTKALAEDEPELYGAYRSRVLLVK